MFSHPLFENPIWQAGDLGRPIPPSTHAVSMALPRWQDVVGYEEKRPAVMTRLSSGYPRFLIHPLVRELARQIGGGQACLPFPSLGAAELCAQFIRRAGGAEARIVRQKDLCCVVTTEAGQSALRDFWQHTGLIVSTRQAEAHLSGVCQSPDAPAILRSLRRHRARLRSRRDRARDSARHCARSNCGGGRA